MGFVYKKNKHHLNTCINRLDLANPMRISRDLKLLGRGLEIQKEAPDVSYGVIHPPVFLGQVQSLILREADLIQPSRRSGDDHHSTHQPDEFTRLAMMSFLTFCGNFLGIFRKCCIPNFFGEDFEPLLILL